MPSFGDRVRPLLELDHDVGRVARARMNAAQHDVGSLARQRELVLEQHLHVLETSIMKVIDDDADASIPGADLGR